MSTNDYANGGIPKTIDELKDYCERNGFTPSKTRFFVGYDYSGAKAFGVYKDDATGEFVVYKNKADGTRAVRYRGTDEEFAVVELYDRLQQEIGNQKLRYAADMAERERNKYEQGSNSGMPESIRNFHIEDHPVSSSFNFVDDRSYEKSLPEYSGRRKQADPIGLVIGIIAIIISLLLGGGIGGGGGGSYRNTSGYSSYSHDYDYDYDYDYDWSSDDWDSGYTDWDSDW